MSTKKAAKKSEVKKPLSMADVVKKNALIKAQAEKDKAAAEKQKVKDNAAKLNAAHGLAITKAVDKGTAIAVRAFGAGDLTEGLGKAIKSISKELSLSSTGIIIPKGHQLTEVEITEGLAGLTRVNEETEKFRSTLKWVIGDMANASPEGDRDRVAAQAISAHGVTKHTVIQTMRVCGGIPYDERIDGLSFTAHQELFNYRDSTKGKKGYDELIKELEEGAENETPMSCADIRERLQKISGKKKKTKDSNGSSHESDEHTFVYIDSDGGATYSKGILMDVVKADEHLVLDVTDMTIIGKNGAIYAQISERKSDPAPKLEVVVKATPVKKEKEPKEPKEPKEAKKVTSSIPD